MIELTKLEIPESKRRYLFPCGSTVTLSNVTHFLSRPSGTHRLRTADGKLHIVPAGWIHIEIEAAEFSM